MTAQENEHDGRAVGPSRRQDPRARNVPTGQDGGLFVLITCIAASALAMIDGSVVNVGLPAVGASLAVSGGGLAWVINGFTLPLSALILAGGALGDRFGRRLALLGGVAVFTAASMLCAFAPTLQVLVAGRLVQGAGAAFLMPNSLAILSARCEGAAKGQLVGIWAASTAGRPPHSRR